MRAPALLAALLLVPSLAAAQTFEISGGFTATGGYDAGNRSAFESPNSLSSDAPPLTLFTTSSNVTAAIGAEARVGLYLSKRVAVEGLFQFTRPTLQTSVGDDFENAAPITVEERATSYLAGGSLLYHFGAGRVVPFIAGGGGYLRQLHEDNALALTGIEIHAGGGVKLWFGDGRHRLGLRFDGLASSRDKSIGFEDKRRTLPTVSASVAYAF